MIEQLFGEILIHLRTFITNPLFLVPTVWITFGCVASWFILGAKKFRTLSSNELEIIWKSHKQFSKCVAKKFETIKKRKKVVGFKCQCGYEQLQEQPLINIRP